MRAYPWILGGWFHRSTEKTEFVALGVGEYVPGFLPGLSHVGRSGAEFEQTPQLVVLAAVDGVEVEVKAKLGLLRFGAGAEDERQAWIVRVGAGRADLNTAVLGGLQDDEAEHLTPEIREDFGVAAVKDQLRNAACHCDTITLEAQVGRRHPHLRQPEGEQMFAHVITAGDRTGSEFPAR
jgi:hypothetical protein